MDQFAIECHWLIRNAPLNEAQSHRAEHNVSISLRRMSSLQSETLSDELPSARSINSHILPVVNHSRLTQITDKPDGIQTALSSQHPYQQTRVITDKADVGGTDNRREESSSSDPPRTPHNRTNANLLQPPLEFTDARSNAS